MTDRRTALRNLSVGDIFHGRSPNGASLVCLVTALTDSTIYARRIPTQDDLEFDRNTGIDREDMQSRIDCVAPFPPDIHDTFMELDRKYQKFGKMRRRGVEPDLEQYKLTPEEHRALLFIDEHLSANPI